MSKSKAPKRKRGRLLAAPPLFGGWVDAKKSPPKDDGHYIIHAPSADPQKPFITMAWYNPKHGWSLLPECWCRAITHWMPKPNPPNAATPGQRLKTNTETQSPHPVGSRAWLAGVELLARRAYPDLKHSGFCSRHRDDGHFECGICYPDLNGLLDAHMEVSNKLYDEILELSGLSDPPNGRVGTNAIVAEIRRKLKAS